MSKRLSDRTESSLRPPLQLALGSAGSGKTEWALTRCLESGRRAVLLVASAPQAETYTRWFAERSGLSEEEAEGTIYTIASFVAALHRTAPQDEFRPIQRTFQRLALSQIFHDTIRPDDYLGRMRGAPGFVPALCARLREWKLACLTPDLLEQGAEIAAAHLDDPAFLAKTREFARLFRAYEQFLAVNRLRDEEDYLRLAAERVASGALPLPHYANLMVVDGFYRFNPAQRRLLAALAARGLPGGAPEIEVAVTLPYDAERPLLFAASERTLRTLRAEFTTEEIVFPARRSERPAPLVLLEANLFEGRAASGIAGPTAPALTILEAPNPYVEAEMVAREFRRMYDAGGYAWNDFAVILRTLGDYAPILSAVFERYEILLGVDGPERLTENPLLKTVLHFLEVVRSGWQREEVLAFLKSSYTPPDKLAVDALRRAARAKGIREGREQWLHFVATERGGGDPAVAETLREMARYEDMLTQEGLEPNDFADTLRDFIMTSGLYERIDLGEALRAERDHAALKEALDTLAAIADMAACTQRGSMHFARFYEEVRAAWETGVAIAAPPGDRVRVVEPFDTRERPIRVAAVMGLMERVFPRRITEDPFLRDEERQALCAAAHLDLEDQRARADDERLFFYLAVTAPSERLLLSYPRASEEADTLPSFYLDEVRTVFNESSGATLTTISRTLADVAPQPEEAVSEADHLLAACADLFDPGTEPEVGARLRRQREAAERIQRCLRHPAQRDWVRRVVASRRQPALPRLVAPELREDFACRKAVYSVSELESYHRCPFQYLLRHVLQVRPEEDGASLRAQGTLLHGVLRRYFRRRARRKEPALPDLATMRAELRELLAERLAEERMDASSHRLRMAQRMLTDALDGFAEREHHFGPRFGLTPTHFELAFGFGAAGASLREEEEREDEAIRETEGEAGQIPPTHDPASEPEPLRLMGRDGGPEVLICGTIDRVDLDGTGQRALVLDYKLGKPPDYAAVQSGSSLQMPLYLLAMERIFRKVGAAACYDSAREAGRPRLFRSEHCAPQQFRPDSPRETGDTVKPLNREQYALLIRNAEATAVQVARRIASAGIEAHPGEHCRACSFRDVCRTTLLGGHDGEPLSLTSSPPASMTGELHVPG